MESISVVKQLEMVVRKVEMQAHAKGSRERIGLDGHRQWHDYSGR